MNAAMRNLAVLALGLLAPAVASAQQPQCQLALVAEWTLLASHPHSAVVEGFVADKPLKIRIDTGTGTGYVSRATADRLGMKRVQGRPHRVGNRDENEYAQVEGLRIGSTPGVSAQFFLYDGNPEHAQVDLVLSNDFLAAYDVEFDVAGGKVRLFRPQNCANASLAYWDRANAASVPLMDLRSFAPFFAVKMAVNGRSIQTLINTGMPASMLDEREARDAGVTSSSPGVEAAGCRLRRGLTPLKVWRGTFDTVAVGDQVVRNARLRFGPFDNYDRTNSADMIVGYDFFRSHRILLSNSQRKIYFSHAGGPAFPPVPDEKPCE